jgi:hypothetical protein|tara:strand:- start:113 stop:430 length:318 start_codon:yes stop_codon:yes gene_type:complete
MSSEPTPEEERLQSLYEEIRSLLENRGEVSATGQAIVLMRIAIENGGAELSMTGIMHVISSMMTQTLGIMSEDEANFRSYNDKETQRNELEDILRNFEQDKTSKH